MSIETLPATNFEDVRALLGPKKETSSNCFCLSYRLGSKENQSLRGPQRFERVRELCAEDLPPGVVAYLAEDDGQRTPVGWAAIHPRADTSFAKNRLIPNLDDRDVWSLWCLRVRPGYRKRGITGALIAGAVEFARSKGAPVVEAYPVDNGDQRVDLTMAYVGTKAMFEHAGFIQRAVTGSVLNRFPRVLMSLELEEASN